MAPFQKRMAPAKQDTAPEEKEKSRAWMYKVNPARRMALDLKLPDLWDLRPDESDEFWKLWDDTIDFWSKNPYESIMKNGGRKAFPNLINAPILSEDVVLITKTLLEAAQEAEEVNDESDSEASTISASSQKDAQSYFSPLVMAFLSETSLLPPLSAKAITYLLQQKRSPSLVPDRTASNPRTSYRITMTGNNNRPQQRKVAEDSPVPAPVIQTAEVPITTTLAMPGPDGPDPAAAATSSSSASAQPRKKQKKGKKGKNKKKKVRRKEKVRLEKEKEGASEMPSVTVSSQEEALDQPSPPGSVPVSRVSSPNLRSSLESSPLVSAADVRHEGDGLEDVVVGAATTLTPALDAGSPDEVDKTPPSSPVTVAVTTEAAEPPSPSSTVATEDRQLWNPWWNLHFHCKTVLQWQHEDGRLEATSFSALTRSNTESPCQFDPGCEQHNRKALCWCPECQTAVRWCCCVHYTTYCTTNPRPEGQGLIVASRPKQSQRAACTVEFGTSATAGTIANAAPPALASKENPKSGAEKSATKSSAEEMAASSPSTQGSPSSVIPTCWPRSVARRLSWPMMLLTPEEDYPMTHVSWQMMFLSPEERYPMGSK